MRKLLLFCFICLFFFLFSFFHSSPKFLDDYFHIKTYHSLVDKDSDGIDDQEDFLDSVLKYVASKPKYKSKYYSTGYPNDSYGVCTDVVAFGMLGAGYDLKELVHQDILNHPDDYSIDKIDSNIDFRRVRNLKVFFQHMAISLTTDVSDIEEWQGGDIVIFSSHIGVVSSNRNKKGIPFLIHHANPYQIFYEEDILESRKDIVGHYRIS